MYVLIKLSKGIQVAVSGGRMSKNLGDLRTRWDLTGKFIVSELRYNTCELFTMNVAVTSDNNGCSNQVMKHNTARLEPSNGPESSAQKLEHTH